MPFGIVLGEGPVFETVDRMPHRQNAPPVNSQPIAAIAAAKAAASGKILLGRCFEHGNHDAPPAGEIHSIVGGIPPSF